MRRFVLAGLVPALSLAALPLSTGAAQTRGGALCADDAMPFAASAGNQVRGAALQQAVAGKRLGYVRRSLRSEGVWVDNGRTLRADGSMAYSCGYSRSPGGPWQPCGSFGSTSRQARGARDIGVWALRSDRLCMTSATFGESSQSCFTIHRQGSAFAAKRVSGPAAVCIQGAITLD
jgi:hypothetical protein